MDRGTNQAHDPSHGLDWPPRDHAPEVSWKDDPAETPAAQIPRPPARNAARTSRAVRRQSRPWASIALWAAAIATTGVIAVTAARLSNRGRPLTTALAPATQSASAATRSAP